VGRVARVIEGGGRWGGKDGVSAVRLIKKEDFGGKRGTN